MSGAEAMIVYQALLKRYGLSQGGGVMVDEVSMNGDWGAGSRADAIYMGFTSKSERLLEGFEIKVKRGDWLRELAQPLKGEVWIDNCHRWWIVATPGIVEERELPEGWGLMVMTGRGLQVKVKATRRDIHPSWDVVRSVVARYQTLGINSHFTAENAELDGLRSQVRELRAKTQAIDTEAEERAERTARDLLARIETAVGMSIVDYAWGDLRITPEDLAQGLTLAKNLGAARARVKRMSDRVSQEMAGVRKDVEALGASLDTDTQE